MRKLAVAASIILGVIAIGKVVFVGAIIFAAFAALLFVGAALIGRRPVTGAALIILPSAVWAVAEGGILLGAGAYPSAYAGTFAYWDWVVVVIGVPVALLALVAAGGVLWRRRTGPRGRLA